jgi:Putative transposase
VSFTLPSALGDIAYQNKAAIYDLLFKASAETMLTIAADPRHLGARIAITAVLHTWGSAMTHHPHVHMIVPGGGLSPDGQRWIAARPNFFLPVLVLSKLFRRLMLEKLAAAHEAGKLTFCGRHAHLADMGRDVVRAICRNDGRAFATTHGEALSAQAGAGRQHVL